MLLLFAVIGDKTRSELREKSRHASWRSAVKSSGPTLSRDLYSIEPKELHLWRRSCVFEGWRRLWDLRKPDLPSRESSRQDC